MTLFRFTSSKSGKSETPAKITELCDILASKKTRGDLGNAIASMVLTYAPRDLEQMKWNFSAKIQDYNPDYRKKLEEVITAHLHGTYQNIRLMNQQGSFSPMQNQVPDTAPDYWKMVSAECMTGEEKGDSLRFLKFLLSAFCMFVLGIPGHPVGMPFPGGDRVDLIDGVYYCPVRTKANDVDSALCPFCPSEQTPEIGYLKPPVKASEHRKQEFIRNCYDYHHFNG